MKAALIVNPVGGDVATNFAAAVDLICDAAAHGADLVLLGEMAITGLVNNDDSAHDLPLGEPLSGPLVTRLAALAAELRIGLGCGFLERDGCCLYDAAVLLSPARHIILHYRRISPHWHDAQADAHIYCQGTEVLVAQTEFGTVAFLLCGDLFHEDAVRYAQELQPDWLFFLFARAHSAETRNIPDWWIKDEMPHYQARIAQIGAATLATSYLAADGCPEIAETFGGAMAVRRDGTVHSTLPLDTAGILYVNMTSMTLRQAARAL